LQARALWNLCTRTRRSTAQAVVYGEAALAIARQNGLTEELAFILHDLARPYAGVGRREEALAVSLESQQLWREMNNLPMLADNLTNLAEYYYITGEFERSFESAQEANRISRETNSLWGEAYSLHSIGTYYVERGEIDQGLHAFEESFSRSKSARFAAGVVMSQIMQAWI
jgi:tetratricopeptide (TPR) repeat protein